jgi:hypothetical protein
MNTIKSNGKKYNGHFLLPLKNWLSLVIFITKCGVISAKESAHTVQTKKEKKFSRSQKMFDKIVVSIISSILPIFSKLLN